jgi:AcrR family transcriptional regulator
MAIHSKRSTSQNPETRQRLLAAGIRLFAEHGYRGVSVRDLCTEAEVNVAAINYHFGGKQDLYHAIFEATLDMDEPRFQESMETLQTLISSSNGDTAQLAVAVGVFVKSMLGHLAADEQKRWFGVLIIRELTFPTAAFDLIYQRRAEPLERMLAKIISAVNGLSVQSAQVRIQAHAVIGMIFNLGISRSILWQLMGWDGYTTERVTLIGNIVTDLICNALLLGPAQAIPSSGEKK